VTVFTILSLIINIWWSKACERPYLVDSRASPAYLRRIRGRLCAIVFLLQVASDALPSVLHPHPLNLLACELLKPPCQGQILMLRVQRILGLLARRSDLEKIRVHCLLLLMILEKGGIDLKLDTSHVVKGCLGLYGIKRQACGHSRHHGEHFLVVRCLVFKLLEDDGAQLAAGPTHLKCDLLALLLVLLCRMGVVNVEELVSLSRLSDSRRQID